MLYYQLSILYVLENGNHKIKFKKYLISKYLQNFSLQKSVCYEICILFWKEDLQHWIEIAFIVNKRSLVSRHTAHAMLRQFSKTMRSRHPTSNQYISIFPAIFTLYLYSVFLKILYLTVWMLYKNCGN